MTQQLPDPVDADDHAEGPATFANSSRAPANLLQYELYFSSGSYDRRYPCPNLRMLRLARALLPSGGHFIDFGCGSGRYLLNLRHDARIAAGFDICRAALGRLRSNLEERPTGSPVVLLGPDPNDLTRHVALYDQADLVLCLFGVLSHVEGRLARLNMLRQLARLVKPGSGRLVVSVPNRLRRFRQEQRQIAAGTEEIRYERAIDGHSIEMTYRLYDAAGLADDLREAGFEVETMGAESLFSESTIARSTILRHLDAFIAPRLPAALGYGLVAVAHLPERSVEA